MFTKDLSPYRDHALLILRLAVAAIFLYHGIDKWQFFQMAAAPEGMTPALLTIMKVLAVAEPLAGIGLVLGLLTQLASLGLIIVMVGALVWKIGIGGEGANLSFWEIDLILLAANIAILVFGPGKISLDHQWKQ